MRSETTLSCGIDAQFQPDVTRDQVLAAVQRMFQLSGCVTCGLRGIDFTMLGWDADQQTGHRRRPPGVDGAITA